MISRLSYTAMWVLLVLFTASVSVTSADTGWGKVSDEEWKMGPPDKYPEANAVIIYDVCTLSVKIEGIEASRWVRMKVFNKSGVEEVGNEGFVYEEKDNIRDLKAQTLTPDGKALKVDSKDIFTKTRQGSKVKTFAFPSVDSGCIVEYHYRNLNKRYSFLSPWYFQSYLYTLKSSFTLILGPGFEYSTTWTNVNRSMQQAKVDSLPNMDNPHQPFLVYTWVIPNLMPIVDEPYTSCRSDFLVALHYQLVRYRGEYETVNFIRNWEDIGKEYQDWFDEQSRGGDLDDLARTVTAGATATDEKMRKIYSYVANEIKTKESTEGATFINRDFSELRKNGYGTAEEKNLLLVSLLNRAGITAWPVMISTRSSGLLNPDICQVRQFNYLIGLAQPDSSVLFMDASSRHCPYGMLPPECLVNGGLLVEGKKSRLVRILRPEPNTYRLDMTRMHLDSSGDVMCSTTSTLMGYLVPDFGEAIESHTGTDLIKEYYLDRLDASYTLDTSAISLDSTGRLSVTAEYKLSDYVRTLDSNQILRPVSFRYRQNPFKTDRRILPIDFGYPLTYHTIVAITADRNITSAKLPRDTAYQIDGASLRRTSQFADGQIQIDTKVTLSKPVYPALDYPDVRAFFDAVVQLQSEGVALVTK